MTEKRDLADAVRSGLDVRYLRDCGIRAMKLRRYGWDDRLVIAREYPYPRLPLPPARPLDLQGPCFPTEHSELSSELAGSGY